MRHARAYGFAGLAALAVAAAAFAQTTVTPLPEAEPVETAPLTEASAVDALAETTWGDPQAGAQKAAVCAACHGVDGNPADPMYPRMAGQSERYIARQLALFKSGERNTGLAALMVPFATMLSAQDMRDVGAYYATQVAGAGIADDTIIASGPRQRQDGDGDRPERPRRHRLRDGGEDRLLEPHPDAAGDAAGGQPHHRPGRLPGSRPDEIGRAHV